MRSRHQPDVLGDEEPTREERKELYEKILRIVELNTGDGAPATMATHSVVLTAGHADVDPDRTRSAIDAAVSNGDLLRCRRDGTARVARTTPEAAAAVYHDEGTRDDPNSKLLGWCYQRMHESEQNNEQEAI